MSRPIPRPIVVSDRLFEEVIAQLKTFESIYHDNPLGMRQSRKVTALIHQLERRREQAFGTRKEGA
jgi:hypothetical protein